MIKPTYSSILESFRDVCAVLKEHIAGRACRFVYDNVVDRDLIVLADDLESLPEPPKQIQKNSEERAADAIQKMSNLLGKSESSVLSLQSCMGVSSPFQSNTASLWVLCKLSVAEFLHECPSL